MTTYTPITAAWLADATDPAASPMLVRFFELRLAGTTWKAGRGYRWRSPFIP